MNEEDSAEGLMTGENLCLVLKNNKFLVAVTMLGICFSALWFNKNEQMIQN